ncbi:hypothetical protein H6F76_28080 [Leptolyngbya sp. FACHB-321]|uniref:hypothetical protein n=1 Tax=Leptolyngbya sp. FACHB-321 TaxID=2692807 RepID=UPI00168A3EF4|nr:hypothetical protein [Leptolyngbya sp. FACHB-321]MBD2038815.1 hypothetical protein [Leptolyngbya sp. FACHB-321]
MPNPKALPPAASAKLCVWSNQAGRPYLVQQQPDGSTTFTPLETALAQAQTPTTSERVTTYREPLNTMLLGVVAVLGFVLGGYLLGFFAGAASQRVVLVPRSPLCDTQRSSFLFWSSETKECH